MIYYVEQVIYIVHIYIQLDISVLSLPLGFHIFKYY